MICSRFSDQPSEVRNSYLSLISILGKIGRAKAIKPHILISHCLRLLVQAVTLTGLLLPTQISVFSTEAFQVFWESSQIWPPFTVVVFQLRSFVMSILN